MFSFHLLGPDDFSLALEIFFAAQKRKSSPLPDGNDEDAPVILFPQMYRSLTVSRGIDLLPSGCFLTSSIA